MDHGKKRSSQVSRKGSQQSSKERQPEREQTSRREMQPSVRPDEELRQLYITWDAIIPRSEHVANDARFLLGFDQSMPTSARHDKRRKKEKKEEESEEKDSSSSDVIEENNAQEDDD